MKLETRSVRPQASATGYLGRKSLSPELRSYSALIPRSNGETIVRTVRMEERVDGKKNPIHYAFIMVHLSQFGPGRHRTCLLSLTGFMFLCSYDNATGNGPSFAIYYDCPLPLPCDL
jgi:hypothetical protein